MNLSITRRDVLWGYAAHLLNVAAGLILLPAIVRFLSPEEVGLWFVFLALASFAQLLEFGFQPTLARNVAYVFAGAQRLHAEGLRSSQYSGPLNIGLLSDLLAAARRIYRWVALAAAVVLLGAGTLYVRSLLSPGYSAQGALAGWLAFATGYAINFYFGYYNALLQGRGDVTAANKVVVASRGTLVLLGALLVVFGWGLLGLGLASLTSCAVGRLLAHRYFFSSGRPETTQLRKLAGSPQVLVRKLWHNASRSGLVSVGGFLILRANTLIVSGFFGLTVAGSYGLSLQLLLALSGVASMLASLQLPRMNAMQATGRKQELRGAYGLAMLTSWAVYCIGMLPLLAFGDAALDLIGSRMRLIDTAPLACFALIMLLEMNHSISGAYLTTLNTVPFVRAALWSGGAMVIASVVLGSTTNLGIWAVIVAQGVVQAAYNNWKWPKEALAQLGCGFMELWRLGFFEMWELFRGKAR